MKPKEHCLTGGVQLALRYTGSKAWDRQTVGTLLQVSFSIGLWWMMESWARCSRCGHAGLSLVE